GLSRTELVWPGTGQGLDAARDVRTKFALARGIVLHEETLVGALLLDPAHARPRLFSRTSGSLLGHDHIEAIAPFTLWSRRCTVKVLDAGAGTDDGAEPDQVEV